jgi:hypothetical protein
MKFVKRLLLSPKPLYIGLIVFAALISCYFWGQAIRILTINYFLDEQIPVRIYQWDVEEIGSDQFALQANFTYELDGQTFRGKTFFAKPLYLNQISAIAALKEKAAGSKERLAWVDRDQPVRCTLEKERPFNFLLRAVLSSAVILYFILFRKKMSGYLSLS